MNAAEILYNNVNPMLVFAVRALASLDEPGTKAEMQRHRSALHVTLEAAGVDMSNLSRKPTGAFDDQHALIAWYDMTGECLRLFVAKLEEIDETTVSALTLLNGTSIGDWENHPIEDVDAAIRMMALIGSGGMTAEELYDNHVAPNEDRYDDDFTPPTLADLEEMWCTWRAFYVGGTTAAPDNIEPWIARTYAFAI